MPLTFAESSTPAESTENGSLRRVKVHGKASTQFVNNLRHVHSRDRDQGSQATSAEVTKEQPTEQALKTFSKEDVEKYGEISLDEIYEKVQSRTVEVLVAPNFNPSLGMAEKPKYQHNVYDLRSQIQTVLTEAGVTDLSTCQVRRVIEDVDGNPFYTIYHEVVNDVTNEVRYAPVAILRERFVPATRRAPEDVMTTIVEPTLKEKRRADDFLKQLETFHHDNNDRDEVDSDLLRLEQQAEQDTKPVGIESDDDDAEWTDEESVDAAESNDETENTDEESMDVLNPNYSQAEDESIPEEIWTAIEEAINLPLKENYIFSHIVPGQLENALERGKITRDAKDFISLILWTRFNRLTRTISSTFPEVDGVEDDINALKTLQQMYIRTAQAIDSFSPQGVTPAESNFWGLTDKIVNTLAPNYKGSERARTAAIADLLQPVAQEALSGVFIDIANLIVSDRLDQMIHRSLSETEWDEMIQACESPGVRDLLQKVKDGPNWMEKLSAKLPLVKKYNADVDAFWRKLVSITTKNCLPMINRPDDYRTLRIEGPLVPKEEEILNPTEAQIGAAAEQCDELINEHGFGMQLSAEERIQLVNETLKMIHKKMYESSDGAYLIEEAQATIKENDEQKTLFIRPETD